MVKGVILASFMVAFTASAAPVNYFLEGYNHLITEASDKSLAVAGTRNVWVDWEKCEVFYGQYAYKGEGCKIGVITASSSLWSNEVGPTTIVINKTNFPIKGSIVEASLTGSTYLFSGNDKRKHHKE